MGICCEKMKRQVCFDCKCNSQKPGDKPPTDDTNKVTMGLSRNESGEIKPTEAGGDKKPFQTAKSKARRQNFKNYVEKQNSYRPSQMDPFWKEEKQRKKGSVAPASSATASPWNAVEGSKKKNEVRDLSSVWRFKVRELIMEASEEGSMRSEVTYPKKRLKTKGVKGASFEGSRKRWQLSNIASVSMAVMAKSYRRKHHMSSSEMSDTHGSDQIDSVILEDDEPKYEIGSYVKRSFDRRLQVKGQLLDDETSGTMLHVRSSKQPTEWHTASSYHTSQEVIIPTVIVTDPEGQTGKPSEASMDQKRKCRIS